MPSTVVVGAQWGDEGKGGVVDLLAADADLVVRYQGGHNAGHTVCVDGVTYAFHLIPSGILRGKPCVLGNGMVIDLGALLNEKAQLEAQGVTVEGKLSISDHAHLILPYHRLLDAAEEQRLGERRIGTTLRGIGPAYMDKVGRSGLRVGDLADPVDFREKLSLAVEAKNRLFRKYYETEGVELGAVYDEVMDQYRQIAPWVTDTSVLVNGALDEDKDVLFEGAHGTLLDIDFGTYPFATSSNPIAGAVCAGIGIGPKRINRVVGVVKAYTTRVGQGPFPTESPEEVAGPMRERGHEYGTTTGRPRRIGWFDAPVVRKSVRVNGLDELAVTHLDVLDTLARIPVCVAYDCDGERVRDFPNSLRQLGRCRPAYEEQPGWQTDTTRARRAADLPANARRYLDRIRELAGASVSIVRVGSDRAQSLRLD